MIFHSCVNYNLRRLNNQELQNSGRYQSLVRRCKAVQPTSPRCDDSYPYRIINGTCNNLDQPTWGSTFSCFWRLWPANYEGKKSITNYNHHII